MRKQKPDLEQEVSGALALREALDNKRPELFVAHTIKYNDHDIALNILASVYPKIDFDHTWNMLSALATKTKPEPMNTLFLDDNQLALLNKVTRTLKYTLLLETQITLMVEVLLIMCPLYWIIESNLVSKIKELIKE